MPKVVHEPYVHEGTRQPTPEEVRFVTDATDTFLNALDAMPNTLLSDSILLSVFTTRILRHQDPNAMLQRHIQVITRAVARGTN